MSRLLVILWLLASATAMAQAPRIAVHPLEVLELPPDQRSKLQALFDVRLARVPDVRFAGSGRVEAALGRPEGKDCESRDACLQHLAVATESLYGVYARLRPDPLRAELLVTARAVRADGLVVRKVSLALPLASDAELTDTGRALIDRLVDSLDLDGLRETIPVVTARPVEPAPKIDRDSSSTPVRRTLGYGLIGVGGATLVAGGVVAGMAAVGRSSLTPDASGAVPNNQASRASAVARQTQAAAVLIPLGVLVGLTGGALVWWSSDHPVRFSLHAGPSGGGVLVGGQLP